MLSGPSQKIKRISHHGWHRRQAFAVSTLLVAFGCSSGRAFALWRQAAWPKDLGKNLISRGNCQEDVVSTRPQPSCLTSSGSVSMCCIAAVVALGALSRTRVSRPASRTPAGWRGDMLKQSSLPFLPDGSIDYSTIDRSPVSQVLMGTVRSLLANAAGRDSPTPGYAGVMELVREVNDMEGTADQLQKKARGVFEGILPSLGIGWIPPLWKKYIQPYFPSWAANSAFFLVFYLLFPWLMGPMEGDDFEEVEVPQSLRNILSFLPATVRFPQTVKAERCRFLEQSSCASVCVNTCKVPSQEWLGDDFGMKVHIQPNYDDFSCRWRFGRQPPPLMEDEAVMVPCFSNCPTKIKGSKDAFSLRQKILSEEDERLARAVAELTPDGTAWSDASLNTRSTVTGQVGKCWSVDEKREVRREESVTSTSA
eukprot:CAMPEP_0172722244 /NCGR_PEP_ID=MMETSP1074-20121228/81007_1 /TAXON_ID=2916 /ORGANISM="Ceratium fusus, Strain PA161109" /LENGTH=422 /DNA_ID=CAMNT_0013548195 /DNA_START=111 /DNA_END=1379 /DNA_ORIENTATION=+